MFDSGEPKARANGFAGSSDFREQQRKFGKTTDSNPMNLMAGQDEMDLSNYIVLISIYRARSSSLTLYRMSKYHSRKTFLRKSNKNYT